MPWDVAISGSVTAREGYDAPLFYAIRQFADFRGVRQSASLSGGDPETLQMDDIFLVNLKVTKVFKIGSTKVDLGVELFNAFNDDATLQIERSIDQPTFQRINERIAPRIARFSATISF